MTADPVALADIPELENPCEVCEEREGYTVIDEPICRDCYERRADAAYERVKDLLALGPKEGR